MMLRDSTPWNQLQQRVKSRQLTDEGMDLVATLTRSYRELSALLRDPHRWQDNFDRYLRRYPELFELDEAAADRSD